VNEPHEDGTKRNLPDTSQPHLLWAKAKGVEALD
jgi:hypothetical protein